MKVCGYSDDRSFQFNFNRQKSEQNSAFYGHWSMDILEYRLDRQLTGTLCNRPHNYC